MYNNNQGASFAATCGTMLLTLVGGASRLADDVGNSLPLDQDVGRRVICQFDDLALAHRYYSELRLRLKGRFTTLEPDG